MQNQQILPSFLRKMAKRIEENKLDRETLIKCGEFYMNCRVSKEKNCDTEITDKELQKYAVCGMWMYLELERMKKSEN